MELKRLFFIPALAISFLASCGSNPSIEDAKFSADTSITLDESKTTANITLDWTPTNHSIECSNFTFTLKSQSITSTITPEEVGSRPLNLTVTFNKALSTDDTGNLKFHFNDKTAKKEGEGKVEGINVKLPTHVTHHISMITEGVAIGPGSFSTDEDFIGIITVTTNKKILDSILSIKLEQSKEEITEYDYYPSTDKRTAQLTINKQYLTGDIKVEVALIDQPDPPVTTYHISMATDGADIEGKNLPTNEDYVGAITVNAVNKILDGLNSVTLKDSNTDITEYCTYKAATDNKSASLTIALMYLTNDIEVKVNLIDESSQKKHTITFDSKEGSYNPESQTIVEGKKATRPDDPTKEGFTFGGWYTDEAAMEYKYDFSSLVVIDLTLYARWDEISELVTVTFDAGEGTFFNGEHTLSIEVDRNSELNLCLNIMCSREPTLDGNTFAYYAYKDTSKILGYNDIVTSDVTIAANYFPTTNLPYSNLNEISWEAIKGVAITKKDITEVFKLGATKDIKFNGVKHTVRIIDFHKDSLHYDYSPSMLSPKTVGITFEFLTVISKSSGEGDSRVWDTTGNNHFSSSTLNTLLNSTGEEGCIFDNLPNELKPLIETVDKKVGEANSDSYSAKTYYPKLFPLAHNEMFDDDKYVTSGEGSKYQYYKNNTSLDARKKKDSKGNSAKYWTRSPCTDYDTTASEYKWVWTVTIAGVDYYKYECCYDDLATFAPAFCI